MRGASLPTRRKKREQWWERKYGKAAAGAAAAHRARWVTRPCFLIRIKLFYYNIISTFMSNKRRRGEVPEAAAAVMAARRALPCAGERAEQPPLADERFVEAGVHWPPLTSERRRAGFWSGGT